MNGTTQSSLDPLNCDATARHSNLIASLDPRIRLLTTLLFIICAIPLTSLPLLCCSLIMAAGLNVLAKSPVVAVLRRLLHVEVFLLVLLAMLPLTMPGHALISVGPLTATGEGFARAAAIALKVNAAVLAIHALLGSLDPVRLGRAAAALGAPYKLVHLLLFLVRYLGVLRAEYNRLLDAMRVRGFIARSNRHSWRSFGNLAGMLLVRSVERAERVDEAMRCRAFNGRFPLTATGQCTIRDIVFGVVLGLATLSLLLAERFL